MKWSWFKMVIILNGHNLKETSVGFDEFLTLEALTILFSILGSLFTFVHQLPLDPNLRWPFGGFWGTLSIIVDPRVACIQYMALMHLTDKNCYGSRDGNRVLSALLDDLIWCIVLAEFQFHLQTLLRFLRKGFNHLLFYK